MTVKKKKRELNVKIEDSVRSWWSEFVLMAAFWILPQVLTSVGCVGRSTSTTTAFRHTSGRTEVSQLIKKYTKYAPEMILLFMIHAGPVFLWPGIVFRVRFVELMWPHTDLRTALLLRLTYFFSPPIESESMVADGLPPTPNSKCTLQSRSLNTIKFICIPAQAVFYPRLI